MAAAAGPRIRDGAKRSFTRRRRFVENPRKQRARQGDRLEDRRVVRLREREAARAEGALAPQGEREPADPAGEAEPETEEAYQGHAAQRPGAALVVAAREALHGEVERGGQTIEDGRDRLVVAGRHPIRGQHPVGERHQRGPQVLDRAAVTQLLGRPRER